MTTSTVRAAASSCGLGKRTLYRYLADPVFQGELARHETALIDATGAHLARELGRSVAVLVAIRDDVGFGPAVRLRAALALIDTLLRLQELRSILARLDRLEERAYEKRY